MDDFASAAMLRLIGQGLRRQGLAVDAPAPGPQAQVPLDAKRQLVEGLLARHGALALLRIGQGVLDAREEPTLTALTLARDPPDLIGRWQRLERFIHSRHRIVHSEMAAGGAVLQHVSMDAAQPPRPAEDLLVIGVIVGLLQRLGTPGLTAAPAGGGPALYRDGRWHAAPSAGAGTASWRLGWQVAPAARATDAAVPATADWLAAGLRALAADPGRAWTLQTLAETLGTSARSLQRRLHEGGSSFTALRAEARLASSAGLLATTAQPPAQIGYICGFADQAHFTRVFKRHTALTPVRYREQFGAARGRS